MANVSFKRGLQADLPNSNIVDGAFYLTTDTNRLYVGGANDKLELLNQSIKFYTYDDVFRENSTVPKVEGQFYYLSDKNILCTFAKTKTHPDGEWVQINPDHNDNTLVYVSGLNVTKSNSAEGNTKKLTYTIELNQEKKESSDGSATPYGDAITASFEINSEDLNKIASNVSVGLESKAIDNETNGFVLKNSGGGADSSKAVQIKGGNNVTIDRAEDGNITIAATDTNTTYNLTSPIGSTNIMLNSSDAGQTPTIELSGDDKIIVKGENAGQITFSHATSSAAGDYNATNNYDSTNVNKIKVPQFTVDATGHISNARVMEIPLPEDKDTTYEITNIDVVGTEGKTGKGKLSISLKASNGEAKPKVSTDDVLYHEITIDGTNYKKLNQESLGEFYSTSKVDELITKAAANMNAMTYKGVIDGDNFSRIKGSQNGDTYKASADFTINEQLVKQGDLVIYNGADLGATADPSTDDWDIVPSGNDIDSQFSLSLQKIGDQKKQTALVLTNTTTGDDAGVIEVAGDKGITTIIDGNKLTIAHATESNIAKTVGANTNLAPGAADTIIVPVISYDEQGHIKSAEDKAITLPADKDTTYTILTEKYGTSDAAVKLKENGSESGESPTAVFKAGTSIVLDASSDGIIIKHADPDSNAASTSYGPNTTGQVGYGQTFKVPKFSKDAKGHIVSVENVDITMPSEQVIPSVNFSGATEVDENNNRVTFTSTLSVGDDGKAPSYAPSIGSSTLKISGTGDNITMDLEWGSF